MPHSGGSKTPKKSPMESSREGFRDPPTPRRGEMGRHGQITPVHLNICLKHLSTKSGGKLCFGWYHIVLKTVVIYSSYTVYVWEHVRKHVHGSSRSLLKKINENPLKPISRCDLF